MTPSLGLLPLLAPLGLALVALLALRRPGRDPLAVLTATRIANVVAISAAAATAVLVALRGPQTTALPLVGEFGFVIRVDALSAVMLGLVAFMGAVVLRFSRNYLDGDARHGTFLGRMALTVACVMMLVLSGHLVHLSVFWALTSFSLHGLLVFYRERRGAVIAARKKWIVARAGDVCLAAAAVLIWRAFGTGELALILEQAARLGEAGGSLASGASAASLLPATFLVALSAALKSAMFPTHGWLAEVMETPTPVSALLHAGIINGGTFLVARLGDVMLLTPPALWFLIVIGGFTALFGSVVLTTQNSVKVALAYSSAAHMGFMLMLCGLGAFPVAILHLVAHSFYKAHAFLSSGSAVEIAQGAVKGPDRVPSVLSVVGGMSLALGTLVAFSWVLGISVTERPVTVGLAAILVISLTQLWTRGLDDDPAPLVLGRTLLAAAGVTLAFFTLEATAARILVGAVPLPEQIPGVNVALMAGVVVFFALTVLAQLRLPALRHSPRWAGLYVHLRNGLYANTWFDRLVGALRPVAPRTLSTQGR